MKAEQKAASWVQIKFFSRRQQYCQLIQFVVEQHVAETSEAGQ